MQVDGFKFHLLVFPFKRLHWHPWYCLFLWRDICLKHEKKLLILKSLLIELWMPVFITLMFILPANFSTTALIFSMVIMLTIYWKISFKIYWIILSVLGIVCLAFFVLLSKAFPDSRFL